MNRKVSQIARALGTDIAQVKRLAHLFADYLSGDANPSKGNARAFNDNDSLDGLPDVDNTASVTVHLPRGNVFTPEALTAKLDDVETLFRPV